MKKQNVDLSSAKSKEREDGGRVRGSKNNAAKKDSRETKDASNIVSSKMEAATAKEAVKEEKEIKKSEFSDKASEKSALVEDLIAPVEDLVEASELDREDVAALTTEKLKLVPSNYQHLGDRERQEDSFAFSDFADRDLVKQKGVLVVVADGMGGLARGDRASQLAVSVFLNEYSHLEGSDFGQFLNRTVFRANHAIFDLALDRNGREIDLGTTLVAAVVHNGEMDWIAVGDSLIYLYRKGRLKQLNREHIYANQLKVEVENGLISKKEADKHPERGYLTSYLGLPGLKEVDSNPDPLALEAGDAVLLCTDGLTNTLSEDEMTAVLRRESGNLAEELVEKALEKQKKHQDNITALVLSCKPADSLKGGGK